MLPIRRLPAVGVILLLAAILTTARVWSDPRNDKDKGLKDYHKGGRVDALGKVDRLAGEETVNRFADQPLSLYQTTHGETLFALQVQPQLQPLPARPRDVAVLIDTSASKAMGPLAQAIQIAQLLLAKLGADDRLALWTVNTSPRSLSQGFKNARGLENAFKELAREYPSGAANLKQALSTVAKSFADVPGRQRLVLLLGDGKSIAGPISGDDRAELCRELVQSQIAFFCVPLGSSFEPANLHGFANGTGGKVVRVPGKGGIEAIVPQLLEAFAEPILYPAKVSFPAEVAEAYPAQLPPLRRDTPTLVVGKLNKPGARLDYTVAGTLGGQEVQLKLGHPVPLPDIDHFFLINIVKQWRDQKDRPALLQADRALAHAFEQNQWARANLLANAEWALDQNKFDAAWKLFKQAEDLDPTCKEARVGQDLVQKLRDGKITRDALKKKLAGEPGAKDLIRFENGQVVHVARANQEPAEKEAPAKNNPPVNNPPANLPPPLGGDQLANVKALQAVADQQASQLVEDTIRQASRMVQSVPDDAHDLLKRTLDSIRNNPDITERTRATLGHRLELTLQNVDRLGARVKRDQAQGLELKAVAESQLVRERLERSQEERIRERLRIYHNLMDQARADLATKQAEAMRSDLVSQGREVPQAVIAAYREGLVAYHVQENREMRRDREERFLATMLQVEKSHRPFPDEPGIEFPTPAIIRGLTRDKFSNWGDFSKYREERYGVQSFGAGMPKEAYDLRDKLVRLYDFGPLDDPKITLGEALDQLAKRYGVAIEVNDKAFKFENLPDVLKTEIATTPIPAVRTTLGSYLKRLLSRITTVPSGATFIIRRGAIEITTGQFALGEKTTRVYPVGDLVIPIAAPGQFIQQQFLNNTGAIGVFGVVGGPIGALGAMGGMGMMGMGMMGGGLGALGALGGGLGALGGGLGALGGGLGALGGGLGALGGALGGNMGVVGALGGNIGGNMGAFGNAGMGGFQGQFQGGGQLGLGGGGFNGFAGSFGLQNNNQSQVLITLIRQVIGNPKDWLPSFDPITGMPIDPLNMGNPGGGQDPAVLGGDNNQLGYYPPALALTVKATSRIHSSFSSPLYTQQPGMGPGMGAVDKKGKDQFAKIDIKKALQGKPGGNGGEKADLDAKKIWQDALAKGVDNPGLIIAVADYLALNLKWEHAAEFLKANLRQGIVVKPWVYESLAIALRESGGSPEEVERAEVAAADLAPMDAGSMLKASQAMAGNRHYDRAVAFCKQAALVEPNLARPYAEALLYAELAQDSKAMEWAAGNLLRQDWPYDNKLLQARAQQKLDNLVKTLEKNNRKDEAGRLFKAVTEQRQRDLVIKLSWQGEADLDLKVHEPCGSICSAMSRQTIGGGTLIGDFLADMTSESYVAAQAFPGDYLVVVERVYGKPLGERAQLTVIRHQGTARQREDLITVNLKANNSIRIALQDGRRTETAYVPPPEAVQDSASSSTAAAGWSSTERVLNQLRVMADPEITGVARGMSGHAGTGGVPQVSSRSVKPSDPSPKDRTLIQNKMSSFVQNSMDVTAQAVLSADRRTLRVSLSPVFNTASSGPPKVVNPVIPGGR